MTSSNDFFNTGRGRTWDALGAWNSDLANGVKEIDHIDTYLVCIAWNLWQTILARWWLLSCPRRSFLVWCHQALPYTVKLVIRGHSTVHHQVSTVDKVCPHMRCFNYSHSTHQFFHFFKCFLTFIYIVTYSPSMCGSHFSLWSLFVHIWGGKWTKFCPCIRFCPRLGGCPRKPVFYCT